MSAQLVAKVLPLQLHITEASTVQFTQTCSVNKKVWVVPTYAAIAYQICKDHYSTEPDVLEKKI